MRQLRSVFCTWRKPMCKRKPGQWMPREGGRYTVFTNHLEWLWVYRRGKGRQCVGWRLRGSFQPFALYPPVED